MLAYIAKRLVLVVPVVLAVALVCFMLVHIAPGDPLISVLPPDASAELAEQMKRAYGFDRPLPVQFGIWIFNALQRQPRHLDRHRPLGRRGGVPRGRQHRDAGGRGRRHRLPVRRRLRLPRRLFPRPLPRPRRHHAGDHRRVGAALLARHGAGHHLLGAARMAAGGRRRSRRLGVGLGAPAASGPAGGDHVGHPDGHRHPHGAGAGRRSPGPGIRHRAARQGPDRAPRVRPRRPQRGADRDRRHGPAARLSARRLDPDRDRVLLAGHRLPPQRGDLPARPAAAAGHDPGARPVLRASSTSWSTCCRRSSIPRIKRG